MDTLQEIYLKQVSLTKVKHDEAQVKVIAELQRITDALYKRNSILGLLLKRKSIEGLYLWGEVGRGKTFIVDLFFNNLNVSKKLRLHFHRFMNEVHAELKLHDGKKDPLSYVAKSFAKRAQVICFDEFYVKDIADAMLLATLFRYLFAEGIVLVATSNIAPSDLYKNGLQRAKFLPAIHEINSHTKVVHIDSGIDYRLECLTSSSVFYLNDGTLNVPDELAERMKQMVASDIKWDTKIDVLGRDITVLALANGIVWFDFNDICSSPRSASDYIELADCFHTVILSTVPTLGEHNDDSARRFISLVDELYDNNVKLLLASDNDVGDIYQGTQLKDEFERTVSRLTEMFSLSYLSRPHLASKD